jgi:hypothetical protein
MTGLVLVIAIVGTLRFHSGLLSIDHAIFFGFFAVLVLIYLISELLPLVRCCNDGSCYQRFCLVRLWSSCFFRDYWQFFWKETSYSVRGRLASKVLIRLPRLLP